ncbi:hypothetical protein TanjilG_17320 [Lupinus angustifolius]|uniref:Mei2-like C-terminal RNA recognition motif domain-containing protein n=1 Tax=Lupinus angustifolius TaxID=3871 RepID=A0A4P1R1H1_LUPAN|nr:PREDICTED: uncharacterized protein LOC109363490 [Lupinus angustifolius]OIV99510.1 hypothetical protein TanjilG_17320 [Lupinus angustifolius]
MAPLNPHAPTFIPSEHKPFTSPCFAFTTPISPLPQHCYFHFSSHRLLYHPKLVLTRLVPFPSIPFHHDDDDDDVNIITKQLSTTTQKVEPTGPYLSDIEPTIIKEAHVQKQVIKEASCRKGRALKGMNLCRRGLREKKDNEVAEYHKCWGSKNRQICGHGENKNFKAFPIKNRYYRSITPVRVDGEDTTVMIKNIPNKYTRELLVDYLEKQCMMENNKAENDEGSDGIEEDHIILAFDFVYLPIDFKSGLNKGYAFVNFTSHKGAWRFNMTASNMKWDLFQSHKIREVVAARLQGKEALKRHFESMHFPCESEEVLPLCFNPPRDGLTKGGEQSTIGRLRLFKQRQV